MRRFYCILAIAILAFTACSKEPGRGEKDTYTTVHFSVNGFQAFVGEGVKSVGDASAVSQLLVGVFDTSGNALEGYKQVVSSTAGGFDFSLDLVKGMTYDVVLFAQSTDRFVNTASWTAASLKSINMPATRTLSVEDDDAFAAVEHVVAGDSKEVAVFLSRAWAQVNVGTTVSLSSITGATLTITGLPITFNALSGEVSGSQTITWTGAPSGTFTVESTVYNNIGYAYAPAGETQILVDATIQLNTSTGPARSKEVKNIPLKKNHRTNIIGTI